MMPNDGIDFGPLGAIFAMAVATYATRALGFWLMARVPLTARLRRMLETLPGAVVVSAVLPIVVRDGLPAALAIVAAGGVMLAWRKDLLAVITGMAVGAAVRAIGM
jgi:uncharacterized membrane protein